MSVTGLRRGALLALAVAMVASACSNGSNNASASTGGGAASASSAASASTGSGASAAASASSGGASGSPAASGGTSGNLPPGPSFGQIGGTVTVYGTWTGSEQDAFLAMVKPFEDATGVKVQYTGTRDLNAQLSQGIQTGTLPDLAGLPGPAQMQEYAAQNKLQDLGSVLNLNDYTANTVPAVSELGKVNGKLVGVFIKLSVKGLVWYNPKTAGDLSSNAPKTWTDLQNFITQNKSKAKNGWCMAVESGAASGWEGTDFIESLVLKSAGPDVYKSWYSGKTKWTDPAIKTAWTNFGQAVADSYGGANYILSTNFANGGDGLFTSPPNCLFHHDATFITGLGAFKDKKAPADYNEFAFPAINSQYANSLEIAGDLFGMFHNTPQAKALMNWLVSAQAQDIWVKKGGAISANKQVPNSDYPDPISQASAKLLLSAQSTVFDASDQMPTDMNNEFFKGILTYIQHPDQLDSVLQHLDQVQSTAYGQ